ncbi:MAG: DUF4012 domain-containing protein [Ilumatobacteraceae bacterium]
MTAAQTRTRHDTVPVIGVCVAAGVCAALAGPSPTGSTVVDTVLVVASVASIAWLASAAPWWVGVIAVTVGMTLAPSAWGLFAGVAAIGFGLAMSPSARDRTWVRAIVIGTAIQLFARLGDLGLPFGSSAAIGLGLCLVLSAMGLVSRSRHERRITAIVIGGIAAGALVAVVGGGLAAASAKRPVLDGVEVAKRAVDELAAGDVDSARTSFHEAAALLRQADTALGRPWSQPARLVPVVAQYRSAGTDLLAAVADVTNDVAGALDRIDPDSLRVRNGTIDIAAVEELEQPVRTLLDSLDSLVATTRAIDDHWLSSRLTNRLDDLAARVENERPYGDDLLEAVEAVPAMLGRDAPRRYFVAFTTPVEVRGLGGFMGNWAEVTIDEGAISFTGFGRHTDLNRGGRQPKTITGPADFLATWGDRGFRQPNGSGRPNIWSDITMSPNFPSVAHVMAELYSQSGGGGDVDGVFAMDVDTVAALMSITGPVEVPQANLTVTPENAAEYLLHDQYIALENVPDRIDALEVVARTTMERLLTSELPSPADLATLLAPFLEQGRLVGWSAHPNEQAMMHSLGMDGALPVAGSGDAMAVALNNAGNSKIDYYLDGTVRYDLATAATNAAATSPGEVRATTTLELVNGAPVAGEPNYVIGNSYGLPPGTSSLYVTVYTALPVQGATVDGLAVPVKTSVEADLHAASLLVRMPSGGSTTIVVTSSGAVGDPIAYTSCVTLRTPPTVRPMPVTVTIDGAPATGSPVTDAGSAVLERRRGCPCPGWAGGSGLEPG